MLHEAGHDSCRLKDVGAGDLFIKSFPDESQLSQLILILLHLPQPLPVQLKLWLALLKCLLFLQFLILSVVAFRGRRPTVIRRGGSGFAFRHWFCLILS